MTKALQISLDDFSRIGTELFGVDRRKWRFKCAHCGHEQSHEEALQRNQSIGDDHNWLCFSCEGRRTSGVGCDWTLGGLFQIHTLEVFDGTARIPAFMFAHPEALQRVQEAAARFKAPEHLTTDAETWRDFTWPDWVPERDRAAVEDFWGDKYQRSPKQWTENAKNNGAPVIGSRVKLRSLAGDSEVEGRYVHHWNNIGAVVRDDGTSIGVSF